jgi:hypothetical protein
LIPICYNEDVSNEVIEFQVCQDGDFLSASWNAPLGAGGITTQAKSLAELVQAIREAVLCHFDDGEVPAKATLHFVTNPEVSLLEAA